MKKLIAFYLGFIAIFNIKFANTEVVLDIPPRRMWGNAETNPITGQALNGFCGETSFQMAGIYYGQYVTSEKIRQMSVGNLMNDLLMGIHDVQAAKKLGLKYEQFNLEAPKPQGEAFLKWTKDKLDNKFPVIAGWMKKAKTVKDEYDHIMPIIGYNDVNRKVISLRYYDLDVVTKSFESTLLSVGRNDCKLNTDQPPFDWCIQDENVYAGTVLGPLDLKNELFRTKLILNNTVEPDYSQENGLNEKPTLLNGKITVSGLTCGTSYIILRFDNDTPPSVDFLSSKPAWKYEFNAKSDSLTIDLESFMSNVSNYYRTVLNPNIPIQTCQGSQSKFFYLFLFALVFTL